MGSDTQHPRRGLVVAIAGFLVLLAQPAAAQLCQDPPGFPIACLGDSNTSPPNSYCNLIPTARNCGGSAVPPSTRRPTAARPSSSRRPCSTPSSTS